MSTRIPTLLEPYLSLPHETSLILLTSVLGASTNWLVTRYLHTLLTPSRSSPGSPPDDVTVILLSFLRDYSFWRDAAGRLGTDLDAAGRKGRVVFVDGLTGLFVPPNARGEPGGVRTGREGWCVTLGSGRLEDVRRVMNGVVDQVRSAGGGDGGERKVVLVVDQLDLLLAAGEGGGMGVVVGDMLAEWREVSEADGMMQPLNGWY
jgi:elongator complex protein 6